MKRLLIALAAVAFAAPATAKDAPPDWAKGRVGTWTVESASEGGEVCTVDLTSEGAVGGLAVDVSTGCRQNYDFADVAAWTLGADGSLRLIDPLRKPVWTFRKTPDGAWVSEERGGQQLVISQGDYWKKVSSTLGPKMRGTFSLSGPNHAHACGFWLSGKGSAQTGALKQTGACPAKWKAKRWARWTLKGAVLTLGDAAGKPILTLTHDRGLTFVAKTDSDLFFGPGAVQGE